MNYRCDVCGKEYKTGKVPLTCTGCNFSLDSNARRYVEEDHNGENLEMPVIHIFDGRHTGFCRTERSRFNTYQKNESDSMSGLDSCDQCGETCRIP